MRKQLTRRELADFRARVLEAFVLGKLSCDCPGIFHERKCPLGDLEVEADEARRGLAELSSRKA